MLPQPRQHRGNLLRDRPRHGPVIPRRTGGWLRDGLLPWFGDRILEVDDRVLLRWRRLVWDGQKANYTYAQLDALLAATALVHELGMATRNTADFHRAGLRLLDPWNPV
jgi:hypothetical protein